MRPPSRARSAKPPSAARNGFGGVVNVAANSESRRASSSDIGGFWNRLREPTNDAVSSSVGCPGGLKYGGVSRTPRMVELRQMRIMPVFVKNTPSVCPSRWHTSHVMPVRPMSA